MFSTGVEVERSGVGWVGRCCRGWVMRRFVRIWRVDGLYQREIVAYMSRFRWMKP